MPHFDYGYMEDDKLGKPYDRRLILRIAAYARSQSRLLVMAGLVILLSTGLELLLPYLTRMAIDDYMIRQALKVDAGKVPAALLPEMLREAPQVLGDVKGRAVFVPETSWRKLDPITARRIKDSGAVDEKPWYLAPDSASTNALARKHPALFVQKGGRWLIRTDNLTKLTPEELLDLRGSDAWGLAWLALVFFGAAGLACLFSFMQHMMLERAGQEIMFSLRQDLYSHILSRAVSFFAKNPVGKLVTRLSNDVGNLNEMFRNAVVALCQDLFLIGGIVVVLLLLNWRLALICFALTPFIAGLAYVFSRMARNAFRDLQGYLGRLNGRLAETLEGLATVKIYRAERQGQAEFDRLNQAHLEAGLRQVRVFAMFMPLTELFSSLAVALIIWWGGGQVLAERLSLGTLVAFVFYIQMFFRPVRDMAEKYNILQAAMASAERIFVLLDNTEALDLPEPSKERHEKGPGRVSFEGVAFGYDPARPVVKDISFTIPPGQTWAVVGPTGAGKTTLVNFLPRFILPQKGRVLIDGRDVSRLSRKELAGLVALVPQEVFLFSGTVRENIALGREGAGEASVQTALKVSGAAEFAHDLEQGLDTPLGEGARRLSDGQRQLLALARALAAEPRVLVLDEATSSVDPDSERMIQRALPRVMKGRTSLVVAHRLSTIRGADNILVMKKGRIVEQGTHEDLMRLGGLYARLVHMQELWKNVRQ